MITAIGPCPYLKVPYCFQYHADRDLCQDPLEDRQGLPGDRNRFDSAAPSVLRACQDHSLCMEVEIVRTNPVDINIKILQYNND